MDVAVTAHGVGIGAKKDDRKKCWPLSVYSLRIFGHTERKIFLNNKKFRDYLGVLPTKSTKKKNSCVQVMMCI
jgi:hypothetical protein